MIKINDIINEYKIGVYESYDNGNITYDEKNILLENIDSYSETYENIYNKIYKEYESDNITLRESVELMSYMHDKLLMEHGGAHRKYLKMLASKQDKLDKLSKYATGTRKKKIDQASHDLSNEYLSYVNSRRYTDCTTNTKDGLDKKQFRSSDGVGSEDKFYSGDKHVKISHNEKLKNKSIKKGNIDPNMINDYRIGKERFKKDFGGPERGEYDPPVSRYKNSNTSPKKQESKKSNKFDDELYD